MADRPLSICPYCQRGYSGVCRSCASRLVSQTGQGQGTSLPVGVQAAWNSYYASQQKPPAISQARNDLNSMTQQPLYARTVYDDNKRIANAASGTPGDGYPYALTLDDDPAFASSAQTTTQRAPTRQDPATMYSYPPNQGVSGQGGTQAQASQQRIRQQPYSTQRPSSSQQQAQARANPAQQQRSGRSNQAQPRDGSSSGLHTAPRPSRPQFQQVAPQPYASNGRVDDSDEEYPYR